MSLFPATPTLTRRLATAVLVLALAGASGCQDYLEVPPQGLLSEAAIRTDPAAAQRLVDGVYNIFYIGGFGPDITSFQNVIMTDIASDDSDKGSTPQDYADANTIDQLTLTSTNGVVDNVWQGYFQAIARVNQAIALVPLSPAPEAVRNGLIGEVRFLRALFYFNLVRYYGAVPLLDQVPAAADANNPALQQRASVEDIYKFVIDDLTFAAANLPQKGATQTGRATKAAAQGLLAKVYLYQKNYQQAYDLTNEIIQGKSGAYSLYPTYADIWRTVGANSDESVFEVQTGINAACNNSAVNLYVVSQGVRSGGKGGWADLGFGFNTPSQALADAYEPGDARRDGTIIFITPTGTVLWDGFRVPSQDSVQNQRYSYKAYHSRTKEPNCGNNDYLPKNIRLLRYAEILLINAEAAVQLGNTAAAATSLNLVRARAGLPAVAAPTLEAVWRERRVELAMEHDRFFDLVRQESVQPGRIVPAFAAQGKTFVKGKNELFPIPQNQINLSGGVLTQNPGY